MVVQISKTLLSVILEPHPEASLFFFFFLLVSFQPCHMACGILVSWSGMEPLPLTMKALSKQSLNHWISREAPRFIFNATLPKLLNDKSLYVLNLYEQYKKSMFWSPLFGISVREGTLFRKKKKEENKSCKKFFPLYRALYTKVFHQTSPLVN